MPTSLQMVDMKRIESRLVRMVGLKFAAAATAPRLRQMQATIAQRTGDNGK